MASFSFETKIMDDLILPTKAVEAITPDSCESKVNNEVAAAVAGIIADDSGQGEDLANANEDGAGGSQALTQLENMAFVNSNAVLIPASTADNDLNNNKDREEKVAMTKPEAGTSEETPETTGNDSAPPSTVLDPEQDQKVQGPAAADHQQYVQQQANAVVPATVQPMQLQLFACPMCGEYFETWPSMRIHLETLHRKFQCEICRKLVSHKRNLDRHRRSGKCDSSPSCPNPSQRHLGFLVHENERGFGCPLCDYRSAHKQVVQRHLLTKHHITNTKDMPAVLSMPKPDRPPNVVNGNSTVVRYHRFGSGAKSRTGGRKNKKSGGGHVFAPPPGYFPFFPDHVS